MSIWVTAQKRTQLVVLTSTLGVGSTSIVVVGSASLYSSLRVVTNGGQSSYGFVCDQAVTSGSWLMPTNSYATGSGGSVASIALYGSTVRLTWTNGASASYLQYGVFGLPIG